MNPTRRLVLVYSASQFFLMSALGLLLPILVLFLQSRGLNLAQCAWVMMAHSAAIFLLELPTGGLADSLGRKKTYLFSLGLTLASAAALFFSWSMGGLVLGAALMGAGRAISSGTLDAWFVDEFKRENPSGDLQKALARVNTVVLFSLAAGTLAGGLLPDLAGKLIPGGGRWGLYGGNLIFPFALNTAGLFFTLFCVRENFPTASFKEGFSAFPGILAAAIRFGLRSRPVLLLLLASFAWGFGFSGLEQFWQPRFREILPPDTGTWIFGILSAGYFFVGMIGNMASPGICALFKQDHRRVLFFSRIFMAGFFFLFLSSGTPGLFALFYLLLYAQNGIAVSPENALFHNFIPGETRATLVSFNSLFVHAGGMLGLLLGGFIAENYSIPLSWVPGALVLGGSSVFFLLIKKPQGRQD